MNKFEGGTPVAEKPEQKKESDATVRAEENNLESEIKKAQRDLNIEKSDVQPINELSSKYVVSERERLDSEMDLKQKGSRNYWIKRLIPEISILPKEVGEIVSNFQEKGRFPGDTGPLDRYINRRVTVLRFELRKRREMVKLKQGLRDIDLQKDFSFEGSKNRRTVYFNDSTESFYIQDEYGNVEKNNISFGDLVGDYSWGIRYRPDITVSHKIWRKVRKVLALYEAREKIGLIFNEELSNEYHLNLPTTAIGLDFINERLNNLEDAGLISGTLAERMITEFLTRVQYNNPQLGMKVEKANSLEDTVLKYDFKVVVDKKRGVALKPEDMSREQFVRNKKRVGVQFTISKNSGKMATLKKSQSEVPKYENVLKDRVDEVALVELPILKTFSDLYIRWLKEGKPSGGPEQYLTKEQKLEIFKQATKGLIDLSDKELNDLKI